MFAWSQIYGIGESDLPMPVRGGVAILEGCGAGGTPVVVFIPVAAAAAVVSFFVYKIQ